MSDVDPDGWLEKHGMYGRRHTLLDASTGARVSEVSNVQPRYQKVHMATPNAFSRYGLDGQTGTGVSVHVESANTHCGRIPIRQYQVASMKSRC